MDILINLKILLLNTIIFVTTGGLNYLYYVEIFFKICVFILQILNCN